MLHYVDGLTLEQVAAEPQVGAGIDLHIARSFSISLGVNHNWMKEFDAPIGPHRDFNSPQFTLSFGWLFGKGR